MRRVLIEGESLYWELRFGDDPGKKGWISKL